MNQAEVKMPKVTFVNEKKEIEVAQGANLRREAMKAGVPIYRGPARFLHCPGIGMCGTCKVLVKQGMENLSPKGLRERFRLAILQFLQFVVGHEKEMRLACQVQVLGDCSIETRPATDLSGETFWQKPYPNK
jgi:ferredoxin